MAILALLPADDDLALDNGQRERRCFGSSGDVLMGEPDDIATVAVFLASPAACLVDEDGYLHTARRGAVQYLISVAFTDAEGHHLHDSDPRFQAWNEMADAFQVAPPIVTGGEIIISAGEAQTS